MFTVILFLVILSVLVLVHEYGHFIAARKSGMRVYEFGLGFPPRIGGVYRDPVTKKWVWVKGKGKNSLKETVGGADREHPDEFPSTLYSINWLPIGGFCKIKGENGEEAKAPDSFGAQKLWKRFIVLVAGVVMNFLLAAVLLGIGFMIGLPADVSLTTDKHAILVEEPKVLVQQVQPESPAKEAGFQFGDRILTVDDVPIETSKEMIDVISKQGGLHLTIVVDRDGEQVPLKVTPKDGETPNTARIGVSLADAGVVRFPWYIAIYKGFAAAVFGLINIFVAFYFLLKNLILGQGMAVDVAGPVGIAVIIGESARLGLNYLLNITAMISLSLAAINILPIPALDGGRVLFVGLEKILRKPVPLKYEQLAHTIGFVLLMVLILVITGRDVLNLF